MNGKACGRRRIVAEAVRLIEEGDQAAREGVFGPRGNLEGGEGAGAGSQHVMKARKIRQQIATRAGDDKLPNCNTATPPLEGSSERRKPLKAKGRAQVGAEEIAEEGIAPRHPASKMLQGERATSCAHVRQAARARSAKCRRAPGLGRDRRSRSSRSQPALRVVSPPGPRRRQDRTVQGAGGVPV